MLVARSPAGRAEASARAIRRRTRAEGSAARRPLQDPLSRGQRPRRRRPRRAKGAATRPTMPAILGTSEIVQLLVEIGRRAALAGGNPFRGKAYLRAAESLAA